MYFVAGLTDRRLANAKGQLIAFLAYDLILIVPFIAHFADVLPDHRLNLIVYTSVLVSTGLLATYHLVLDRETRLFSRPAG